MSKSEIGLSAFENRGEAVRELIRSFREDRLDRAVLLCGPQGIGKETLATLLAQGVLCGQENRPCGECKSCRRVQRGTHPDCLTIRQTGKSGTVSVDPVRELLAALSRHPLEGDRRVVLQPRVEKLSPAAQNALLKTLEETRAGTWFLLTTDNETAVLSTIRSRCRLIRVAPFTEKELSDILIQEGVAPGLARETAALSDGSLTSARDMALNDRFESLRDQAVSLFLSGGGALDYAHKAGQIRALKDQTDELILLAEQELRQLIESRASGRPQPDWAQGRWEQAPVEGCRRVLQLLMEAQRMRASNVSAQALTDYLVQHISEETDTWQQS